MAFTHILLLSYFDYTLLLLRHYCLFTQRLLLRRRAMPADSGRFLFFQPLLSLLCAIAVDMPTVAAPLCCFAMPLSLYAAERHYVFAPLRAMPRCQELFFAAAATLLPFR